MVEDTADKQAISRSACVKPLRRAASQGRRFSPIQLILILLAEFGSFMAHQCMKDGRAREDGWAEVVRDL